MLENGFSLTLIFPYNDRIYLYTGKYGQKELVFWHILPSEEQQKQQKEQ